ncbi:2,3-epoxybenzoyl-CoA dihydrolase [Alphaproteobacteria bacterium HT1-32]|nr:2,3-epoxybenzoyl-CoA dihydrolase [Alphaproteobacteria bacterium HT1-32]
MTIDFRTEPGQYKHWKIEIDGNVATLTMDVDEKGGLVPGYDLKLNSYDLGVDIELYDATQRLRFCHPEVGAVVITSGKDRVFCSGANITMLAGSSHAHKVNFCKFTNETRMGIEDASDGSQQRYICAINGTAAGGGYELALATDEILLVDDGSSAVSLPEVPLLAVLPGTGGLTRVVDKRMVRRDHADFFCTVTEGIKGKRARDWRLVDELVPRSRFDEVVTEKARQSAARSDRPKDATGIDWPMVARQEEGDTITYGTLSVGIDRSSRVATFTVKGPTADAPANAAAAQEQGIAFWPLALARDLDDAILHLRTNETDIGVWALRTSGDGHMVESYDNLLAAEADNWFIREVRLYLKRCLKRLDVTSRSLITLIEPGSCFTGTLLELVLAADRSYMLDGSFEDDDQSPAALRLTAMNFGPYPMGNGLTRLQTRFLENGERYAELEAETGRDLLAEDADELGLVTFIPDDIDWEDEVRLALEERAAFSPDSLTGMEASLRFAGPETMETKIFGRLTAWQNWIFQRPNAVGEAGALRKFGTGTRAEFDPNRV